MKKAPLALLGVTLLLASCTVPTMPWSKAPTTTDTEVVTEGTDTDTDAVASGETVVPKEGTKTETPVKSTDTTPSDTPK